MGVLLGDLKARLAVVERERSALQQQLEAVPDQAAQLEEYQQRAAAAEAQLATLMAQVPLLSPFRRKPVKV
jgi:Tfp pilus assembly protein PilO